MVDFGLVASGAAIGVAVAAPIGPVNLIVIRRTLRFGNITGFISGLGAAVGDGVFASIAAFGLTAAMDVVLQFSEVLQFLGGIFLLVLGARTFLAHPHIHEAPPENTSGVLVKVFAGTFALTITNPATMLGFIAIFGGVAGLTHEGQSYGHAATLVGSVMLGSAFWWAGLSSFVSLFRGRMNDRLLEIVNRVSGGLIVAFGIVVLVRVVYLFFR
ncbi:LysE family translocator [Parvibaculum sp.]|uniref:LysE family translocator n=1 Tax=Parvibaculum sp. TaxID=2024848 RepID=UPI002BCDEF4D|nr:LysE family transporter [Parvibaculum sp.]HUD49983.1 LysE family transporter [Parvibaculum sp.]